MSEHDEKSKERLGLNYDNSEVEASNVAPFAKVIRVVGLLVTIGFICWGLLYDWRYSRSPFEQLLKNFGFGGDSDEFSYILAVIIFGIGWYYRFQIGSVFSSIIIWFSGIIKKLFKSI